MFVFGYVDFTGNADDPFVRKDFDVLKSLIFFSPGSV